MVCSILFSTFRKRNILTHIINTLSGGFADQFKYAQGSGLSDGENGESGSKGEPPVSARGPIGVNLSGTFSFKEENEHFQDSRAEAKKAHAERMLVLRQVGRYCAYFMTLPLL